MADIESKAAATAMRSNNERVDDPRARAADAAMRYQDAPIARLTIDQTRALVASVSWTQSGGDPSAENRLGLVGQYLLTPGQLARAGFVDPGRLAEAMDGQRSEWSWAAAGGARQFLGDSANWRQGLDVHAYRSSEQLQNASFRAYCDDAHARARGRGVLDGEEKPGLLAGYLKVHAVMGEGPADSAIGGGRKFELPGRDSNFRLLHHLSRGLDGMEPYLAAAAERARSNTGNIAGFDVPLDSPQHPDRARFALAREMVEERFGLQGAALDNAAAVAAFQAREAGVERYGEVLKTGRDAWVIDTHRDDPAHHRFVFDPDKAAKASIAETSRAYHKAFGLEHGAPLQTAMAPGALRNDAPKSEVTTDPPSIDSIRRGPAA